MDEQILMVSLSRHFAAAITNAHHSRWNLPGAMAIAAILRRRKVDLMPMQRIATLASACGALAAAQFYSMPAQAMNGSDVLSAAQSTAQLVQDLIVRGYRVAPALMLGLGLLALMPVIALLSPLVSRAHRADDATRRHKGHDPDDGKTAIDGDAVGVPAHAFLEVVGGSQTRFAILRDMMRIGREDDNDIRIPSNAVHRYHAAIHREYMQDWHITDLSGTDGNGIRVNGQRCSDACLHDGDVIELGPGRLRFRAGLL